MNVTIIASSSPHLELRTGTRILQKTSVRKHHIDIDIEIYVRIVSTIKIF